MKKEVSPIDLNFKIKSGETFEVPVQGSLGLLALGDIGLLAWRQKKMQVFQEMQKQKSQQGEDTNMTK